MPAKAQSFILNNHANLDFGLIEFDATYSGVLKMGTDGGNAITGSGLVQSGSPQAGHVQVTGAIAGTIEVRCSNVATMSSGGGQKLTVSNIEVASVAGVPFGSGSACNGNKKKDAPALVIDSGIYPNPNIFIGGRVDMSGQVLQPDGNYSTTQGVGKSLIIDVVFQ